MINKSIVLMGCKHCGKSTHGKSLAAKLGVPFYDTDYAIEKITGMSYRDYYLNKGPAAFMQMEEKVCEKLAEQCKDKQVVIATGGGICDNPPALSHLRKFDRFVFLELDINYSVERILSKIIITEDGKILNAPAYILPYKPKTMNDIKKILMEKYTARFETYRQVADITVQMKNAPKEENFKLLLGALDKKQ